MSPRTKPLNAVSASESFRLPVVMVTIASLATCWSTADSGSPPVAPREMTGAAARATFGHPTQAQIEELLGGGVAGGAFEPPIAIGPYINFESPAVRPLALHAASNTLLAVNTPNNSLVVFNISSGVPVLEREYPVGLEPVAVAFAPGAGRTAWVVNRISDSISVVDVHTGRVVDIIPTGDEPVNIMFNSAGTAAFIVLESGQLVAIDVATRSVISTLALPGNNPRAAAYDAGAQRVYVAALHSGNNTSVVGKTFRAAFIDLNTPGNPTISFFLPTLFFASFFDQTAALFAASPLLSPWPDVPTNTSSAGPLVERIVPDATTNSDWKQIVDVFADDNGNPDPAMMAAFEQQVLTLFNLMPANTFHIFDEVIRDARATQDNDVFVVDVSNPSSPALVKIIGGVGTTLSGIAVDPQSGNLLVTNKEPRNLDRLEPALNGRAIQHQVVIVSGLAGPSQTITPVDLHASIPNFDDASQPNPAAQAGSLADAQEIVTTSSGEAFVAALGTGRIGRLRSATGEVTGRVDVGRGTRGLVVHAGLNRLFAFNRTEMSISTVDIGNDGMNVLATTAMFNPDTVIVRKGRDFLFSARHSNNFSMSCASCHPDGHLDHLAWDLGNPDGGMEPAPPVIGQPDFCTGGPGDVNHPLKGPMVTLSLRGLKNHESFHWRGDRPHFTDFNGAFASLVGGSQISDDDMAAFDAFIKTLHYPPPINRNRDNSFAEAGASNGRQLFINACDGCHQLAHDGAMNAGCEPPAPDVALDLNFLNGQLQEVPQLRGIHKKFDSDLYDGFGLLHDGREERELNGHPIQTFLLEFFPGFSAQDRLDLIDFLEAYPTNVAPVVGWQIRTTAGGPNPPLPVDLAVMFAQHEAAPSRCDVVAHVLISGAMRGFVMVSANQDPPMFQRDDDQLFTLAQVVSNAAPLTPAVFTAVPPGSGRRIGIDQDNDGFSNGIDPCSQYRNDGDMNGDGQLNNFDIDPFVLALTQPDQYAAQFPGLNGACAGDVNGIDGLNNFDIDPFVELLVNSGG
ncbi:MAG: YncE family protein [Phycisphaerales bacterium]|nr:YncE family protein [Phycisphaerales bacterium]